MLVNKHRNPPRDLNSMHKVVLEVPGEQELKALSEKLKENEIRKL